MFHLLNYFVSAGAGDANVDMTAASTDGVFSRRNSHYIFGEEYDLLAWSHLAVSATRARLNSPTLNTLARYQVWPVNRAATPGSFPRIADYRSAPIKIPVNEEIAVEESNNLAMGNEDTTSFLWIGPRGWRPVPIPVGERIVVRATGALAIVGDSWATGGTITFAENLRSGTYAVVGAYCQSANLRAFRLFFPKATVNRGKILRPGMLTTAALGNLEAPYFNSDFGVWGYFNTFEPPLLEVYGDTTGADTQEIRLDLVYTSPRQDF